MAITVVIVEGRVSRAGNGDTPIVVAQIGHRDGSTIGCLSAGQKGVFEKYIF